MASGLCVCCCCSAPLQAHPPGKPWAHPTELFSCISISLVWCWQFAQMSPSWATSPTKITGTEKFWSFQHSTILASKPAFHSTICPCFQQLPDCWWASKQGTVRIPGVLLTSVFQGNLFRVLNRTNRGGQKTCKSVDKTFLSTLCVSSWYRLKVSFLLEVWKLRKWKTILNNWFSLLREGIVAEALAHWDWIWRFFPQDFFTTNNPVLLAAMCHRLTVRVPGKSVCWDLNPNVMVLGGGTSGRWLGQESRPLMNGASVFMKKTSGSSLAPGKDSASRWPENPEAGPCRTVNLSAPQSWTSQHPGCRKSHASHSAAQSMVCYSSQQTETPWKHRLGFFFCPWLPTTLQGKQRERKDRLGRKCLRVPSSRETPGSMNGPPSGQETASRSEDPVSAVGSPPPTSQPAGQGSDLGCVAVAPPSFWRQIMR